ncbi:MAG: hypothetical protein LBQ57_01995 [Spirochaetales bacterium]|nr:hypothetical protein [Spirochaetales bacterium]
MGTHCARRPEAAAVYIYFAAVIFLVAGAAKAPAQESGGTKLPQESGMGAAILLGEPMGISAKLWISEVSALDAGAGWSLFRRMENGVSVRGAPYFYFDYLRHFFNTVKMQTGKFVYSIGVGLENALAEDMYMGVRLPFGMSYAFEDAPLDIFLELVPSIVFFPDITSDMGASAGLRYWF